MIQDELRAIRERQSLETRGMTTEEAKIYFKKGADEARKIMAKLKEEKENYNKEYSVN